VTEVFSGRGLLCFLVFIVAKMLRKKAFSAVLVSTRQYWLGFPLRRAISAGNSGPKGFATVAQQQ